MSLNDAPTATPVAPTSQSPVTPAISAVRTTWPGWLGALLLILATVLAYIPAMQARFIWDDDAYVYNTDHDVIKDPAGLKRIWTTAATPQWYPLVFTTYWFEYRLWGFNPAGYHVVNILLHALAAVLLWRLLLYLKVPGAWFAAAIFALHPVHVETVAWVTERKNTLSIFFYLIAFLAYLRFADRMEVWWYPFALAAFLLALFSKTVTCTLPVAILLAFWLAGSLGLLEIVLLVPGLTIVSGALVILLKAYGLHAGFTKLDSYVLAATLPALVLVVIGTLRARQRMRWVAPLGLIPFFVTGLFMGKLTGWYEFHKAKEQYWEPMPIGQCFRLSWTEGKEAEARSEYKLALRQRVIIAARALLFYPQKLVFPHPQSFFYPRWNDPQQKVAGQPVELDTNQRIHYSPGAAVLGIGVLVVILSVLYGRGIFIAFAFFTLTIFPALGFFATYPMRYSFVADHFQYLASVGLTTLLAAILATLFRRVGGVPIPAFNGAPAITGLLALGLLVALGAKTAWRCRAFHDEETLWLDTIQRNPHAWGARVNLGIYYAKHGDHDKAVEQFQAMIDDGSPWQEAYANLGNIYALRKDYPKAESLFRKAIDLEPRLAHLYMRLAKVLILQKKEAEALKVYERAAELPRADYLWSEEWPKLYEEWAALLEKAGRKELAAEKRAQAEAMRKEIAAANKTPPKPAPAAVDAEGKIDLGGAVNPQDRRKAYLLAASAAITRRDYVYAMRVVQAGCQEFPQSAGLWKKYALLIAASPIDTQRDGSQAVTLGEKLRQSLSTMNSLDDETRELLAAAYAEVGRFDDAVRTANEGLQLARSTQDPVAQHRLQKQIELYTARKPYRLPAPVPTPSETRPVGTQPAQAQASRPAAPPAARPASATPSTRPLRIPASSRLAESTTPTRDVATRPAVVR